MREFRHLKVWQLAVSFSVEMRNHFTPGRCRSMPNFRVDFLTAARSISNNIAEGFGRSTVPDTLRFLDMSMGSLSEVENGLEHALQNGLVTRRLHYSYVSKVALMRRMLRKLRRSIDPHG